MSDMQFGAWDEVTGCFQSVTLRISQLAQGNTAGVNCYSFPGQQRSMTSMLAAVPQTVYVEVKSYFEA